MNIGIGFCRLFEGLKGKAEKGERCTSMACYRCDLKPMRRFVSKAL